MTTTATDDGPRRRAPAIDDHGVIGDCETLALVTDHGEIDWMCWPRADSHSIFGSLLDPDAGHWSIHPTGEVGRTQQFYLSETNVLVTRFQVAGGIVEIDDAMAMAGPRRLVRRVRCVRGDVQVRVEFRPAPGYGADDIRWTEVSSRAIDVETDHLALRLASSAPMSVQAGRVVADLRLCDGDEVVYLLGDGSDDDRPDDVSVERGDEVLREVVDHWKLWSARGRYRGRYRAAVERSALALKLLTNRTTGGMLAAGTTSLPEHIGGERNWDYRYVWIRDAAFTVYALLEIGHDAEAEAFIGWLVDRVDDCERSGGTPLTPLYDLDGTAKLDETTLPWRGYEESRPVRIGNAAAEQVQLDIYGELIDSLYLFDRKVRGLSIDTWDKIRLIVDHVIAHWRDPDDGMWEIRSGPQRHTVSVMMCWVAVERAIRMAEFRGRPADLETWRRARDEMHDAIVTDGWNDELGAFTQTFGGDTLDASILLAPLVKFVDGHDPRWTSTLDAVVERLTHGPLVDRYDTAAYDDGLDCGEGSFTICSFWLVEALARAGRVDQARRHFDQLLGYANPVGLFSEQIGPTGRQLGNTPQALTHLALISAAVALDEALDREES
ncbi:MAG: glycoside hydrolase family 15 protein [Ilumatobacter sp.]|nr:glycoside hydrolase family 15 protein [Ilumatobacter sp.]